MVVVYPTPVVAVASTPAAICVFVKSISSIWFLTGVTSYEFGIAVTRICDEDELSTSATAKDSIL